MLIIKDKKLNIKAVLFDFDGVIGQTMEDNFKAWKHAFGFYGIKIKKKDYFLLEGMGPRQIATTIVKKYKKPVKIALAITNIKMEYYKKHNYFKLYPGVVALLNFLSRKKIKTALVSGATKTRLIQTLPNDVFNKFFPIITSEDIKKTKPHPIPYLAAVKELKFKKSECIVVENAPLGILSAKRAGLFCIAITSTLQKNKLVMADFVIKDLRQLKNIF